MNDLILAHEIPAPLEVLPQDLGESAQALAKQAQAMAITDARSFEDANGILMQIHDAAKKIEARRTALKKPITQLGKAIDSVCANVAGPLDNAKRALLGRVQAYQQEQARLAAEAARKAAEARAKAEAEARAEQARLEAEARAKAEAEAAELSAVLGADVEPVPVHVDPVLVAVPEVAPVAPAPVASAVTMRKVPVLVVDDERNIPAYIGDMCLRPVDRAALKRALDAGAIIPGARIELQEQAAMRGTR